MVAEESRNERPLSLREGEEVQEVPWPGLTNATSAGVGWCSIAEYVWRREAGGGGGPLVGAQRDDPRQDVVERLVHLLRERPLCRGAAAGTHRGRSGGRGQ